MPAREATWAHADDPESSFVIQNLVIQFVLHEYNLKLHCGTGCMHHNGANQCTRMIIVRTRSLDGDLHPNQHQSIDVGIHKLITINLKLNFKFNLIDTIMVS